MLRTPRSTLSSPLLLLLALPLAACGAPSAERPDQGVARADGSQTGTDIPPASHSLIYDGSAEIGNVFVVGGEDDRLPVEVPAGVRRARVHVLDPALHPDLQSRLPPSRPSPPEIKNACDALDPETAGKIDAFLADAEDFADWKKAQVESCAAAADTLVQKTVDLIRAAEKSDEESDDDVTMELALPAEAISATCPLGTGGLGSAVGLSSIGYGCQGCTRRLSDISRRLQAISRHEGECSTLLAELQKLHERVKQDAADGTVSREIACLAGKTAAQGRLKELASRAENLKTKTRAHHGEITRTVNSDICSTSRLEEACNSCSGQDEDSSDPVTGTPAVFEVPAGPALGRVVGALHRSARELEGSEEGEALRELASRIERIRWSEVRRVVYPSPVSTVRHFIAVRAPDREGQPPIFILTAVPEERLPELTLRGQERWFRETAAWREMLTLGSAETTR